MNSVSLKKLRYFCVVAEELHFGRAAARLHVTQPPLSQQIKALESALGVVLFDRTSRRVALTPAGATLYDDARDILQRAEIAVRKAQSVARGTGGHLTVGFVSSVMLDVLPRAIREFRAEHPDVSLTLQEQSTARQLSELLEGTLSVGFLWHPPQETPLLFETVSEEPLLLAIPRNLEATLAPPVDLAQVAKEDFVLFPRSVAPGLYDHVVGACAAAGFTPRVVQESQEIQTTLGLVRAGVGVSIVPGSVRYLEWPGVTLMPTQPALPKARLDMVRHPSQRLPALDRFVETVLRSARQNPKLAAR